MLFTYLLYPLAIMLKLTDTGVFSGTGVSRRLSGSNFRLGARSSPLRVRVRYGMSLLPFKITGTCATNKPGHPVENWQDRYSTLCNLRIGHFWSDAYFSWGTRIHCPFYPRIHVFSVQFWVHGDVLRNQIPRVSYKDFRTRLSLPLESDVARLASPRPQSRSDKPSLFLGASRSQSPQADSPLSYLAWALFSGTGAKVYHYCLCQNEPPYETNHMKMCSPD